MTEALLPAAGAVHRCHGILLLLLLLLVVVAAAVVVDDDDFVAVATADEFRGWHWGK